MFTVVEGQTLSIGQGQDSDTHLRDLYVGPLHCELQFTEGKALLLDIGGPGGTKVNGKPITQHELQPGDTIQIGETRLSFAWSKEDDQPTASDWKLDANQALKARSKLGEGEGSSGTGPS
jgi:pSer/pThr/pTyr-binding forkhead associated (FHA) protein